MDKNINKLYKTQEKILNITKKYDNTVTVDNYQEKSIELLLQMGIIDTIKMNILSRKTLRLLNKIKKENK